MELVASIEGHRERLLAALAERYGPRLRDGEILPDWGLELELTVRDVLAALKRLVELDDQVDRRSSAHETLRLRRDRLVGDPPTPRRGWRWDGRWKRAFDWKPGLSTVTCPFGNASRARFTVACPSGNAQRARFTVACPSSNGQRARFTVMCAIGYGRGSAIHR